MTHHKVFQPLFFAGLALLIAAPVFAQQEVIEKRQALMKSNSAATKAIKAAGEAKAKGESRPVQLAQR